MMKVGKNGTRSAGSTRDRRQSLPAGLSQVNLNAAGIDVGASSHFVAVPEDRWEPPVREFHAYTADLYRLADWLAECGIKTVAMESTGVEARLSEGVGGVSGIVTQLAAELAYNSAPGPWAARGRCFYRPRSIAANDRMSTRHTCVPNTEPFGRYRMGSQNLLPACRSQESSQTYHPSNECLPRA